MAAKVGNLKQMNSVKLIVKSQAVTGNFTSYISLFTNACYIIVST